MAALTGERSTDKKHRDYAYDYKAKGNVKGYSGGGACIDTTGFLVKAADAAGLRTVGRLNESFDTTATGPKGQLADGAIRVQAEHGIFKYGTTGGSAIVQADVGAFCYWLDDQTVVKAAGTVNSVKAGKVVDIDDDGGIWVDTRQQNAG